MHFCLRVDSFCLLLSSARSATCFSKFSRIMTSVVWIWTFFTRFWGVYSTFNWGSGLVLGPRLLGAYLAKIFDYFQITESLDWATTEYVLESENRVFHNVHNNAHSRRLTTEKEGRYWFWTAEWNYSSRVWKWSFFRQAGISAEIKEKFRWKCKKAVHFIWWSVQMDLKETGSRT